jgi:CheY-like chemotaxis protein
MSASHHPGAGLARAPFFVEERLEEALERASVYARDVDLCLEIHPEVPELVLGHGEQLREAVITSLCARMGSRRDRLSVRARCPPHAPGDAKIVVSVDDDVPIELDVTVISSPSRALPAELSNRRAVVIGEGCAAATLGLLARLGLRASSIDESGAAAATELAALAPEVVVVDVPRAHAHELTTEDEVRERYGLGRLPLVIATEAALVMSPGSAATSISRPVRRSRLASALRMVLGTAAAPSRVSPSLPDAAALKVLVVDDQPLNRAVVLAQLKRLGVAALDAAAHGLDAVEACRTSAYDLVLMDLQMPVLDGLDASRRILAEPGPRPRIVALTASTSERDRLECQRVGMRGLLTKPVSEAALAEQLELTVRASAKRARPR